MTFTHAKKCSIWSYKQINFSVEEGNCPAPSISKYRKGFGTVLAKVWTNVHEAFQNLANSSISCKNWVSLYAKLVFKFSAQQYFLKNVVCNFQSIKRPVELNTLLLKFFCHVTWFDEEWHGGLANETYLSNPIVSSKQSLVV